ncbi:uncharacterized protein PRCAT00004392001 [Priceomyces carsonii]|uniref:uncharacterized protein n=1 Tax=Priceomyces carsonii TaxID=28549 RepID=UPI002ED8D494|nr:unnamed protein product [Priceomyces carsonii]
MTESLKEKYNRSRELGYRPSRSPLYPKIDFERNKQSYLNAELSRFASNETKRTLSAELKRDFLKKAIDRPQLRHHARNPPLDRSKWYNGSPIKSLSSQFTPSKVKPNSLYKLLNTTPRSKRSVLTNRNGRKYTSKSPLPTERKGLFNKLRNYLTKFSLNKIEMDDSSLNQLKNSAQNVLKTEFDPKIRKKVTFDSDIGLREPDLDNDFVDDVIRKKESQNYSSAMSTRLTTLQDVVFREKSKNEALQRKFEQQISDLEDKYKVQIDSLRKVIERLKDESASMKDNLEQSIRLDFEEALFQKHELSLIEQKRKERELQNVKDQLSHEKELLANQRIEVEQKLQDMVNFSYFQDARRQLESVRNRFAKKRQMLLQKRVRLGVAKKENEDDFIDSFKKSPWHISLRANRSLGQKYKRIKEKLDEYSRLLIATGNSSELEVAEIQSLVYKLRENLTSSETRKQHNIQLLDSQISSFKSQMKTNKDVDLDRVYQCFEKKQSLLDELDLIASLLVDINSILKQLSDIEIESSFKSLGVDLTSLTLKQTLACI